MRAGAAFIEHALGVRVEAISPNALDAAKRCYLDTLTVGAAGSASALAEPLRAAVRSWGTDGQAPVWGTGERLPAASAAFVNAFQIHCQEYDCVHEPAVVHPMASIGAALTAEAARRPTTGRAFLTALVVAVDVAAGLGVAARSPIRFFRPATAGVFGAALGIARLRGFDEAMSANAAGHALAQAAGTMQAHVEGTPALPVQIAGAARAALVACDLAEAGLAGPRDWLEGPYGYLPLFEESADADAAAAELGRRWRIAEVSLKPWPTGRAAHGGVALMLELRAQGLTAETLQDAELRAPPLIPRLVGRPAASGMSPAQARLSFAYLGAVALGHGRVGLEDFTPAALADPAALALAGRIAVSPDGSEDPAAFAPQTLTARLKDGRTLTARTNALYGSPAAPMSQDDQIAKQEACLAFAGLPAGLGEHLRRRVAGMEGEPDAAALAGLLTPEWRGT